MKMSGLWKALPLTLGVVALNLLTIACGTNTTIGGGQAQIRMINAIPDGPAIDVEINRSKVITNLPFGTVQPAASPATYLAAPAGNVLVQGFATSTTNPVSPTGVVPLVGGHQYTLVAVGLEVNESAPLVLADNNLAPIGTQVEFRIINASPSSPLNGVDVYLVPTNSDISNFTPQISALPSGQASQYQTVPYLSGGYDVIVTAKGFKTALITLASSPAAGSITTIVLLDNPGGNNGMSTTPLVLNDLD